MYLIINLGLKSIRGIIFDDLGEQIFSVSYPIHTSLFEDKVEQDPSEWIVCLEKILSEIAEKTNLSAKITHITATTSSSCILGLNSHFLPETQVLMVSDKRASSEVEEINEHIRGLNNESNQRLINSASCLAPKALWFLKKRPTTFKKVKYWLGAGEMIGHYFTGEVVTDPINAAKFLHNGSQYEDSLLEQIGLISENFPKVVAIGTSIDVSGKVIEKYKLSSSCKFIVTTYDAICAVIGSATGGERNACDVSGTVTSVRILSDQTIEKKSDNLLIQSIPSLNKYIIGSSNNLGGGIIEWFKQSFFQSDENEVYFEMENYAQQSSIGSKGIIFLPFLLGERSPFTAHNASGTFFGINRSSSIKDFTRAVFESTAFVTRDLLELIEDNGIRIESLSVSGGLARFDTINQIKADVCNKPVHVTENFESTSMGAFMLLALAIKKYDSLEEASYKVVKIRKTIYPSKKNYQMYDKCFQLYRQLNQQLLPMYEMHKQVMSGQVSFKNEIVKNL